jgi:hypothetical protein
LQQQQQQQGQAQGQGQQLEMSWWLPSSVGEGHPLYAALLGSPGPAAANDASGPDAQYLGSGSPAGKERLLFARVGKAPFVFCGRLEFARHLVPEAAGEPGGGIAWALVDAPALAAEPTPAFEQIMRIALIPADGEY